MEGTRGDFGKTIGPDRTVVVAQIALEAAIVLGAPLEYVVRGAGFAFVAGWVRVLVGLALFVPGVLIVGAAKRDLADSFTTSPTPTEGGRLVESGIYARMRHPMYTGALLLTGGWAIAWGSWFGVAGTLLMTVFLLVKSRYEDRLLARRYPGYAAYRQRVPGGLIPRP